jgi:hypothetical protein
MLMRSSTLRRRIAEMIPTDSPTESHTITAPRQSEMVAGSRSKIWDRTLALFW